MIHKRFVKDAFMAVDYATAVNIKNTVLPVSDSNLRLANQITTLGMNKHLADKVSLRVKKL